MDTTRKDFGTTIATLARLYTEAERSGDTRRAKVYAAAVDVLLDAWPAEPESLEASERRLRARPHSAEETLIGLGATSDRAFPNPIGPVSGLHRRAESVSGRGNKEPKRRGAR
jgi:hypothetical protein